ncbi:hypothetical protein [Streptomyces sp. CAU 1734]|uniref:hypothetical protein n=1 Tax=Streptomyces sp. CAU 1734 TaxID=3140360 RepID=UPI00326114AB
MNDHPRVTGGPARGPLPAFLRRLDPPRTADGRPDYRPPAAALAAGTALSLLVLGLSMAHSSGFWDHHRTAATAAVMAGTVLPALAVYSASHRLLARTGLYLWQSVVAGIVFLVVIGSAQSWAQHLFPRAYDRYEREFGGPGQCLHHTPYHLDRSQTTFTEGRERMVVEPVPKGPPPLRLDNAVDGGLKPLTPADSTTRKILTEYGC